MPADTQPSGFPIGKYLLYFLLLVLAAGALYFAVVLNWSYSSGERAGWVQKFSKKGWICKTWEGEVALVSMPGSNVEKFHFTVTDDEVAAQINKIMGRRVTLHYEQKVGLPGSCFGESRYYVTSVGAVEDGQISPGIVPPGSPSVFAPPGTPATPMAPSGAWPAPSGTAPAAAGASPGLPSSPAVPARP
jgi:hypothetical protein